MKRIVFPDKFPSTDDMMGYLRKTFEKSWKVELDIEDVHDWLRNFTGVFLDIEDEQRLALWLLCNFTYYNVDEVNHLCRIMFNNFIHRLLANRSPTDIDNFDDLLSNTYFTCIGNASESGGLLLYHFRQEAQLSIDRFAFPTHIPQGCDTIVCVDDVMLSGTTASRFFKNHQEEFKEKKVYYLALLTSESSVKKLEELGITVIYCTCLDERSKILSESSLCFFKFPELRTYAYHIAEGYGKLIEPDTPLGFKDGQYAFGFYYNIPNNSLPIFWSSQNNWNPILFRKEKYQNAQQAKKKYGIFV